MERNIMEDPPSQSDTLGCVVVVEPSNQSGKPFKGYIIGINQFGEGKTKVEFVDRDGNCRTARIENVICYTGKNVMDFGGQPAGYVGEYIHEKSAVCDETRIVVKVAESDGAVVDFPDSARPTLELPIEVLVAYVETGRYQRV